MPTRVKLIRRVYVRFTVLAMNVILCRMARRDLGVSPDVMDRRFRSTDKALAELPVGMVTAKRRAMFRDREEAAERFEAELARMRAAALSFRARAT